MILIIDDELNIRLTLKEFLEDQGYKCIVVSNANEAREILKQKDFQVIICDLKMPGLNGLELMKLFKKENPESLTQFIMITGLNDSNTMRLGFKEGAADYLYKPIDLEELKISLKKALEKYSLNFKLKQDWNEDKKKLVASENLIKKKHLDMIKLILKMIQARDKYTEEHCARVYEMANILATMMKLKVEEIAKIKLAALLHDVGKIAVSDSLLLKPGELTEEEYEQIKLHSSQGYEIIKDYVNKDVADLVLYHHESFDGTGYPTGLVGKQIPLGARIIAIVDQYDALRNERPYRTAFTKSETIQEMQKDKHKFDPQILEFFLSMVEKVEQQIYSHIQAEKLKMQINSP